MPHSRGIRELTCGPVCRCLTFGSSKEDDDDPPMDDTPSPSSTVPVQHHADTFQQSPSKCALHTYVTLKAEEEDMEEDFQTVPLDDEYWDMEEIPNKHYVFMNMPYHMDYAHTHAPMQTMKRHHTTTHWI